MIHKTLPVGRLQCNCQILVCPETHDAVLVDPGDEPERILKEIAAIESKIGAPLKVRALFHTHAHFDHVGGTRGVKEGLLARDPQLPVPEIYLHKADEFMYQMLPQQGAMFGFNLAPALPVDRFFEDEQALTFGKLKFTVIHTPGHSPGGVCLKLHEDSTHAIPETVFTGDTLFQESVGRSDLWGGDGALLKKSIRQRLLVLDDDTRAWPGHGPSTTIGHEKRANPYVR